jgi:hypothetical protein
MEDIGATSFTLAQAIVELVANSIDARPLDSQGLPARPLNIEIGVDPDEVSVVDDAVGMTEEALAAAVRLGVKMQDILGRKKRKGMYGLGLKTAAASIGRYWSVLTRPEGDTKDYFLEFDLESFAKPGTKNVGEWTVDIEERPRAKGTLLGSRSSGTAIEIRKLRDKAPMAGAVLRLVGDAYKPHIDAGDVITVNGDPATPTDYHFLDDSRVLINEVVGSPSHKRRVTGWVALDAQTHNDGQYGFNLYRNNQLIETWDKSWFSAHLMTSRIIGEAHLDFMPVNFNKQGFQTQSAEWRETRDHMTDWLRPVVQASREASRGRGDETKHRRAIIGMKRALNATGQVPSYESGEEGKRAEDTAPVAAASQQARDAVFADRIVIDGHEIVPSSIIEDLGSEVTPWDYIAAPFDGDKRTEVQAVLNSGSLLFTHASDQESLGILAVADCVTRYLVERRNFPAAQARGLRDQWIHLAVQGTKAFSKATKPVEKPRDKVQKPVKKTARARKGVARAR